MVVCPKCNKQLEDGTKFCDSCGAQIPETVFCPNCGQQTSAESAFCQNCGASIAPKAPAQSPAPAADTPAPEKGKLPKKPILYGVIAVAAVAVIIFLISLFSGSSSLNYSLYLKDKDIFYTDLSKKGTFQVSSKLVNRGDLGNEGLKNGASTIGRFCLLTKDGKLLFFPDRISEGDKGFALYYRNLSKPKAEPVKVDSDVRTYHVNDAATTVTYLKDGTLYQYNMKKGEKEKIESEVETFRVSDDGKKLYYRNGEGNFYLKVAGKDKEKIDSEVNTFLLSEDWKTVYYKKEDSLYRKAEGKDKEKIASDVYTVLHARVYNSGKVYFLQQNEAELTLASFVTDDLKDADAAMTEPVRPTYPTYPSNRPYSWNYDTTEEYQAALDAYNKAVEDYNKAVEDYNKDYEQYQEDTKKYREKQNRDDLRDRLEARTLSQQSYTLCFYNGKEVVTLTDSFNSSSYTSAADEAVMMYQAYSQSEVTKVKLSEVTSVYDVELMVDKALGSSLQCFVAVGGEATEIDQENASRFCISDDGKTIYFMADISEEDRKGDLYKITVSGGKVGKSELYDNDVYAGFSRFITDDQFMYIKDIKDGDGELFINKTKIDDDVTPYSVDYQEDSGKILYYTDWNGEKDYGTLKVYDKKKTEKVADDVHSFTVLPNGTVLYITDYSLNYFKGELYQWKKGKAEKLDDDVVALLPILDGNMRGM